MSKNLFIIPCSSKKDCSKLMTFSKDISEGICFHKELEEHRNELIGILEKTSSHIRKKNGRKIQIPKQNIEFNKRTTANILYNPGKLYTPADSLNWNKEQCEKIYIISALFGIIRADNYIPYYDLAMDDKLDNNISPLNFWKKKLDPIIKTIVKDNIIIIDLLSDNYRNCIKLSAYMLTNTNITWKDSYGNHRGKWLKENL